MRYRRGISGVLWIAVELPLVLFLLSCAHNDPGMVPAITNDPRSAVFAEILSRDRNRIFFLEQFIKEHVVVHPRPDFNFDLSYEENQPAIIQTIQQFLIMDPAAFDYFEEVYSPYWDGPSPWSPRWPDKYWE